MSSAMVISTRMTSPPMPHSMLLSCLTMVAVPPQLPTNPDATETPAWPSDAVREDAVLI
jgi:hypothetical protein